MYRVNSVVVSHDTPSPPAFRPLHIFVQLRIQHRLKMQTQQNKCGTRTICRQGEEIEGERRKDGSRTIECRHDPTVQLSWKDYNCQNVSAASEAITTYIGAHLQRFEAQQDQPLLLKHVLSATAANDDLLLAFHSTSGGPSTSADTRTTNFRRRTVVWYLRTSTCAPLPANTLATILARSFSIKHPFDSQSTPSWPTTKYPTTSNPISTFRLLIFTTFFHTIINNMYTPLKHALPLLMVEKLHHEEEVPAASAENAVRGTSVDDDRLKLKSSPTDDPQTHDDDATKPTPDRQTRRAKDSYEFSHPPLSSYTTPSRLIRALSPPASISSYSSPTLTPLGTQQKVNVNKVAIEGKAKQNEDSVSIKMYLKMSLTLDSVSPGQTVQLFPEENVKILSSQVHPLDSNSVSYNFDSAVSPLLNRAARALKLPERSKQTFQST
ncbi:hypothetical protein FB446DRAFT_803418, partial [Lentinula raphanica]